LVALRDGLPRRVHDRLQTLLEEETLHDTARIRAIVAEYDAEDVSDAD